MGVGVGVGGVCVCVYTHTDSFHLVKYFEGKNVLQILKFGWLISQVTKYFDFSLVLVFIRRHIQKCLRCLLSCFSCVRFFVTLWTVVPQAPLSMGFSR